MESKSFSIFKNLFAFQKVMMLLSILTKGKKQTNVEKENTSVSASWGQGKIPLP